ncbi:MAG: M28 family peptidase [Bacteroidetes bacterium]|nr:M28 family peptidase [Bacteroidota bacterium]
MNFKYLFIAFPLALLAQHADTTALRFAKYIKAEDMKKNLVVLASDEYEGRETGEAGQKMAAAYISNYYKELSIPPINQLKYGYQQSYPLHVFKPQTVKISTPTKEYKQNVDFYTWNAITGDTSFSIQKITSCGYGIKTESYNDYKNIQAPHDAVLILSGEPFKAGKSELTQTNKPSEWTTNYRMKLQEARKQGIKYLFVVESDLSKSMIEQEHRITASKMSIEDKKTLSYPFVIYISKQMASDLAPETLKESIHIQLTQEKHSVQAENVMAYIEGTDLKNEVLVLSAHYDHLGIINDKVYNGADDDGSGTAAIMQLAKAFQEAKKQGKGMRRSLLFLNVSGEEKGLLGSEYYTENPVFPLAATVCDLNIDMIGRLDEEHAKNPNYVYLIGSDKLSSELHTLSEQANKTYTQLQLDYTFNNENDPNRFYYRSDHYNFAKHKVPVIFYFNGVHEDYHQETDEVQKINFNKMEKITRLVFFTAWEIANKTERLKIDSHKK